MSVGDDYTFVHEGVERTYKMYRPADMPTNAPMVFVLHGMTSSSTWSYLSGFNELAEEHGFLAVYPQSHLKLIRLDGGDGKSGGKKADMSWLGDKADSCKEGESFIANGLEIVCRDGVLTTSMARWNAENDDDLFDGQSDVEFLSALARSMQDRFQVDPHRTFVAGFSNGGYMSYTLMCQARGVFRAAGVVSGLIDGEVFNNCRPDAPIPIIHIHGADDGMVPIAGSVDKATGVKGPGAREIVEYFANLNEVVRQENRQVTNNAHLTIFRPDLARPDLARPDLARPDLARPDLARPDLARPDLARPDLAGPESGGAEVHYYRIENHDHVWPGGDTGAKQIRDVSGIDASRLIWDFFARL